MGEDDDAVTEGALQAAVDCLSCPICLSLLREPRMLPCCQQSFCRVCLETALFHSATCPLCNAPAQPHSALPNRSLDALLICARAPGGTKTVMAAASSPADDAFLPLRTSRRGEADDAAFLPLPAMQRRPRWAPGDSNPFLVPSPQRGWLERNEERLRCLVIVGAIIFIMGFLKVQEEEFAQQTGYWRHGPPRLTTGIHHIVGDPQRATRSRLGQAQALHGPQPAAVSTPSAVAPLVDATSTAYGLFAVLAFVVWLHRRATACASAGLRRLRYAWSKVLLTLGGGRRVPQRV